MTSESLESLDLILLILEQMEDMDCRTFVRIQRVGRLWREAALLDMRFALRAAMRGVSRAEFCGLFGLTAAEAMRGFPFEPSGRLLGRDRYGPRAAERVEAFVGGVRGWRVRLRLRRFGDRGSRFE